jgi:tetratricopeptide (TPR) repeat protein
MYHLSGILMERGLRKESDSVRTEAFRQAPNFPYRSNFEAGAYIARRQFDSAEASVRAGRTSLELGILADVQMARGEARAAVATLRRAADSSAAHGDVGGALDALAAVSWIASMMRNQPAEAAAELEAAERRYPIERGVVAKRPYYTLAAAYAAAGRVDRAKQLIREGDRQYSAGLARWYVEEGAIAKGLVALAEQRPRDAIAALDIHVYCGGTAPRTWLCPTPFLAEAYDRAGNADSARAALERYVNSTASGPRSKTDGFALAQSLQRLGELYEAKGDRSSSIKQYERLLELWKNADPELKPRVDDIRKRVARLSDTERK